MIFGPAVNRRFSGSGRPREPGTPCQNVGGFAPHILEWFLGPPGPPRPRKSTISGRPNNHVSKTQVYVATARLIPNCFKYIATPSHPLQKNGKPGQQRQHGPAVASSRERIGTEARLGNLSRPETRLIIPKNSITQARAQTLILTCKMLGAQTNPRSVELMRISAISGRDMGLGEVSRAGFGATGTV